MVSGTRTVSVSGTSTTAALPDSRALERAAEVASKASLVADTTSLTLRIISFLIRLFSTAGLAASIASFPVSMTSTATPFEASSICWVARTSCLVIITMLFVAVSIVCIASLSSVPFAGAASCGATGARFSIQGDCGRGSSWVIILPHGRTTTISSAGSSCFMGAIFSLGVS